MKIGFLSSVVIVQLLCMGVAQGSPTKAERLDSFIREMDWKDRPGIAVGVYQKGKAAYAGGFGVADLEEGRPVTTETIFNVASVSKQFTAFAVLLLAHDGMLDLDEDIRTFLPHIPDYGRKIAVRNLIYQTSGLREVTTLFNMAGRSQEDFRRHEEAVNLIERQKRLSFEPGTAHRYCNTNYILLAEIVQAVSGQTFREFAAERIFKPLGMAQSFFRDDIHELIPGKAGSYRKVQEGQRWVNTYDHNYDLGSSNLHTTVEDLLKWAGNFVRPKVGDSALIREFTKMGALNDGTPLDYGWGLNLRELFGYTTLSHSGGTAAFRAEFNYFPEDELVIVLLRNSEGDNSKILEHIVRTYLGRQEFVPTIPDYASFETEKLDALVGSYLAPSESMISISHSDGTLVMRYGGSSEASRLVTRVDGTFDTGDGTRIWQSFYTPIRDDAGAVVAIIKNNVAGGTPTRYERIEKVQPTTRELESFTGTYRSVEVDTTFNIAMEGDQLAIRGLWLEEPIFLSPSVKDRFETPAWWLRAVEFDRDANGNPIRFRVHAGRLLNVPFERVMH